MANLIRVNPNSDPVIEYIRQLARKEPSINRMILFGSRARGDHQERSDYDIAVESTSANDDAWARWALELKDRAPTLCGIDLVRVSPQISSSLRNAIDHDGIVIYDRKETPDSHQ